MKTNTSLSGFTGDVTEAKGVMSVELTVGSKTLATAFFVVDVKSKYNILLGRDWIHANGCVSSTLHQCLMQWVDDDVEVIGAEGPVQVATADTQVELQGCETQCLSGRDLSNYDYVSVSNEGFVPINVKPMNINWLDGLGL